MTNLTQAELNAVIDAASKADERHAAMILFSYFHGARRGEVLALRGGDVRDGFVTFRRIKQREDKGNTPIISRQPLHAREQELIEKFAVQAGDGLLFPYSAGYASRLMQKYLRQVGAYTVPRQKSLHSLRHSAGHNLYRAGKDIVAVAAYLGHKHLESSRRYTNLSETEVNELAVRAL